MGADCTSWLRGEMLTVSSAAVSIIIPSHNAAEYLADALQSVRDQTLRDFDCLIVDDGSVDASRSIAQQFADHDERFKLITLYGRQGASNCRNSAIEQATGRWIALLDADDLFLPDRLEVLTAVAEREGADIVFDDQWVTEYPSTDLSRRAFGFKQQHEFTQEDFFSGSRLFRRPFPTGYMKPLIRRAFLEAAGAAYDASVPSGEDFLFYAELFAGRPRCIATNFAGYVYRRRRGSLSRSDEHLHHHADLGERILSRVGDRLSVDSRAALAGRRRDFEQLAKALPAVRALQTRDWRGFAGAVASNPELLGTIAKQLRTAALRCANRRQ